MMIFSVKCMEIVLLLYVIHDVASHPKSGLEDGKGAETFMKKRISLGRTGKRNLKSKYKREGYDHIEGQKEINNNNQTNEDIITGHIKLHDEGGIERQEEHSDINSDTENIAGSTQLLSDIDNKDESFHNDDDGIISDGGKVSKPEIDLSKSDSDEKKDRNEDVIAGQIVEDDDGNIEGEIKLPDYSDFSNENGYLDLDKINNNKGADGDVISGSIEINDNGSIEGTINVPDVDDGEQYIGNTNRGENADEDAFTGSIELNEDEDMGTIEGHLVLDDGDVDSAGGENIDHKNKSSQPNHSDLEPENRATTSKVDNNTCWLRLNGNKYLDTLDQLAAKYSKARQQFEEDIGADFDNQMTKVLLSSQGKAPRAIHQAHGNPNVIPAGLNLGGLGMLKMPGCMLFFHRLKLRNSTIFNVNFLQTSFMDMTIIAQLSLNDLHLSGVYERAITKGNDGTMYFRPSHGELDVLIKLANYKMEGRLRMLNNRLMIETIYSELTCNQILVTYANSTITAKEVTMQSIDDFIGRVKCDLDVWLKDYFNDYLMYFGIVNGGKNSEFQLHEKQKTIKCNEYADNALRKIKRKLRELKAGDVKLPAFTLLTIKNQRLQLKNGVLRGLDSIYRRSVAMTKKTNTIRTFDLTIGFSNLKVQYNYEGFIMRGTPPLAGLLILSADELTAHLTITQVDETETVDIHIDSILQMKPESLTVEGPANRLIADFKYILENPIVALMINVMKHNIKMLKTLTRCEPYLWGQKDSNSYFIEGEDELFHPKKKDPHNVYEKNIDGNFEADEFSKESHEAKLENPKDKGFSDYVFSKNDSVELEVPVNGKVHKMNLKRNENFVLSKLP